MMYNKLYLPIIEQGRIDKTEKVKLVLRLGTMYETCSQDNTNFELGEKITFKLCERKLLSHMREKAMLCVRKTFKLFERNFKLCEKREFRFCNLNHLSNLVLTILAYLVDLLNWVLAILVHFAPFRLTGFILVDFG